jgi:hypothetical protein
MPIPRRILVPAIAGAAAVVLAVGVVTALTAGRTAPTRTLSFTAATGDVPSPERGWYDRVDIVSQRDFSSSTADGVTLLHSYVQLDAFRDSAIDQTTLDALQGGLDAVRAAGLKIVLRFAYNQGPYPDPEPDASESRILQHLHQLTPVLAKNQDVIASVEAGFVGAWGEWHDSTHGLDHDADAKKRILAAILAAVPADRDVELRYPADIRALAPTAGDATVPDGSSASRVGNHQDCFLSSDPDDTGTFDRDGHSPASDKKLIAGVGRHAVVGGETCAVSSRTTCTTALRELRQMGFTYLNRGFDPAAIGALRDQGCADEIGQRLGYRLAVTTATVPADLETGATSVPVTATIRNTGFASPYEARPVYVVVRSGEHRWMQRVDTDVRAWEPGGRVTIRADVRIPAGLPAGATTVSLWMPDAAASLRDRPAYALRLATDGVWDATTGENVLQRRTVR